MQAQALPRRRPPRRVMKKTTSRTQPRRGMGNSTIAAAAAAAQSRAARDAAHRLPRAITGRQGHGHGHDLPDTGEGAENRGDRRRTVRRARNHAPPWRKRSRKGKSPIRDGARNTRRSWADRMSDPEEEAMGYSKEVEFSDSETEDQSRITKIVEVLERTGKFLQESCTRRVPNSERRVLRNKYPLPKVPATRPAQLDHMMRSETSAASKTADKQLVKIQALLLDSLAPFTSILEAHRNGDIYPGSKGSDPGSEVRHYPHWQRYNAHLLHLQRERIVGEINKALLPIVGDDNNFKEATPLLFGMEFAKKSKEMVEQVKAMRSTITKKSERRPSFF